MADLLHVLCADKWDLWAQLCKLPSAAGTWLRGEVGAHTHPRGAAFPDPRRGDWKLVWLQLERLLCGGEGAGKMSEGLALWTGEENLSWGLTATAFLLSVFCCCCY